MFTGIIEEVGRIKAISRSSQDISLEIEAKKVLEDVKLGDSIAVNGTCLTVTSFTENSFTVDTSPQTLRMTSLGSLTPGSIVNLERALALSDRLGGHIVSGHVDGLAKLTKIKAEGRSKLYYFSVPKDIYSFLIEKGSVTLDGVSLTIAGLVADGFYISLIPHTLAQTSLEDMKLGQEVNIETDMIGKYVKKFVENKSESKIDMEFLLKNGF